MLKIKALTNASVAHIVKRVRKLAICAERCELKVIWMPVDLKLKIKVLTNPELSVAKIVQRIGHFRCCLHSSKPFLDFT